MPATVKRYHRPLVKALAQRKKMDSFRFDFAHALYNAPGWDWHMAQFQRDVEEIKLVVQFLKEKWGYKVGLGECLNPVMYPARQQTDLHVTVVAHSKASLASWMYFSQIPDPPRLYVNLSGRYDMKRASRQSICYGPVLPLLSPSRPRNNGPALLSQVQGGWFLRVESESCWPAYCSESHSCHV